MVRNHENRLFELHLPPSTCSLSLCSQLTTTTTMPRYSRYSERQPTTTSNCSTCASRRFKLREINFSNHRAPAAAAPPVSGEHVSEKLRKKVFTSLKRSINRLLCYLKVSLKFLREMFVAHKINQIFRLPSVQLHDNPLHHTTNKALLFHLNFVHTTALLNKTLSPLSE